MPTSQLGSGGEWGSQLPPDRFARALAAAGVLAAIDAARLSATLPSPELMPASAAQLLRDMSEILPNHRGIFERRSRHNNLLLRQCFTAKRRT